ncbi:hypothetical protein V6N12_063314 [Hibiscus sabdariffa]|uniref:Retrovirus-related Pol polyprotein from transposon TNT 1-94-like beta-barrel domain-containing protein n=1 Tax=Hibiscus sabdariffa TaxID=183260 RepID=A0ABR2FBD0_9ROSI
MLTSQLQAASIPDIPSSSVNLAMQGKILSFVNSLSSFNVKNCWIIDSRASRHACYSKDLFESLSPITVVTILLPNKTVVLVGFAGNIRLLDHILLKDVLYVPEFRFNLLAVSSLIKDTDLSVLFSKTHCVIQDLYQVIGKADSLIDPFPDTVLPYIVHDVSSMTQPQVASVSRESDALLSAINSGAIKDNVSSPLVPKDVHIHEFSPASISSNGQDHGS